MRPWPNNPYLKWYRLTVWIGIIANFGFAIPALFYPYWVLSWLNLPLGQPTVWLRDAGGLLSLLTLMFIPAAADPFRYKFNAGLLVIGRLAFGLFWFWLVLFADFPRGLLKLAYADTAVGIIQAIAYVLLLRYEYMRVELPDETPVPRTPAVAAERVS